MSQPQWGVKRRCANCSAPFYDLQRDPIRCPKCDTVFTVGPVPGNRPAPAGRVSRARTARAPYSSSSTLDTVRDEAVPDDSPDDDEETVADEPEELEVPDAEDGVVEPLDDSSADEIEPPR